MKYSVPSHLRWSLVIAGLLALPLHAAPLTWSGSSGGTWDTTTAANWGGTTWNSATPDDAIFGATGVGTINLAAGGITAQSLTFNTNCFSHPASPPSNRNQSKNP